MAKKTKPQGAEAFDAHFAERFGERWPVLKNALIQDSKYQVPQGLIKDYFMDPASMVAAELLGVQPGDQVLDLCAAPGGKSLVLALGLQGQGELYSNEPSDPRRARLHRVLEEHLSPELHQVCKVTGRDGTLYSRQFSESFDKVLCDVPCGTEAHVLASPEHLKEWTPSRSKTIAIRQFALLCSGFDCLKPGGSLVYSTCSLSQEENDEICRKLIKKRQGFSWIPLENIPGESTEFGKWILPDAYPGEGPIFMAKLIKNSEFF